MMAQFHLTWTDTDIMANVNDVSVRAEYRRRMDGGSFLGDGFTPGNDMAKGTTEADSKDTLDSNVVYQFIVSGICTVNGPSENVEGIREMINFIAINPVLTHSQSSGTINLDVTATDIIKARLTLRLTSDNSLVGIVSEVDTISGHVIDTRIGLTPGTNYYWEVELGASVDNNLIFSPIYSPYPFITDVPLSCVPITAVIVTTA